MGSTSASGAEWGMFIVLTLFMTMSALLVPAIQTEFGFSSPTIDADSDIGNFDRDSMMSVGSSMWSMFSPFWSYFGVFPAWLLTIHFIFKIIWFILLIRVIIIPAMSAIGDWIPFT